MPDIGLENNTVTQTYMDSQCSAVFLSQYCFLTGMRIPSLSLLTRGTWSPSLHPPPPRKVLLTLTFSYLYY